MDTDSTDPISQTSIVAGADAICPAGDQPLSEEFRAALDRYGLEVGPVELDEPPHRARASDPPCQKCQAKAESVLRGAWAHDLGTIGLGDPG